MGWPWKRSFQLDGESLSQFSVSLSICVAICSEVETRDPVSLAVVKAE